MELIVDIQCFKYENNIIIKELAAVDADALLIPRVYVFQPPCAWDQLSREEARENSWLQRNYHGLEWDKGTRPFNDIQEVFKELNAIGGDGLRVKFNVKGLNKKRILERYVDDVYNLEDMRCPSLHTPGFRRPEVCVYHRDGWVKNCALQNVIALRAWILREYINWLDEKGVDTVN